MGYSPRKRNKPDRSLRTARPLLCGLGACLLLCLGASPELFALTDRTGTGTDGTARTYAAEAAGRSFEPDTDVDIALGTFNYFFNYSDREYEEAQGRTLPDIGTGIYFGAYMSSRSRLFTFFFNARNFYSIYEAGVALNMIQDTDSFALSVPLTYDLAYRLRVGRKSALYPFAGTGVNVVRTKQTDGYDWQLYFLVEMGAELKYALWTNTNLKFRATYGLMFIDNVPSGFMHVLKVRFPVPFLP
jgi:hypothetical protein